MNPCATRIYKTLKLKTSKIGLLLVWASRTGALDCRRAVIDRPVIDLLLLRANAGVFNPLLGHSSASALDRKCPALDGSHRLQLLLDPLLDFPNSCPLSPKISKCSLFLPRSIKQRKHKKKVK